MISDLIYDSHSRITISDLRIPNPESQITNHKSRITNYELQNTRERIMAIEREVKFIVRDGFENIRNRLKNLGAIFIDRYFEQNIVFDYPDKRLKNEGILVRLRSANKKNVLCLKNPILGQNIGCEKVVEEFEMVIENKENLIILLTKIGLEISLKYEKIREKWEFDNTVICLDTLPFGDYLEIEGTGDLRKVATDLGLDYGNSSTMTYHEINAKIRKKLGLPPMDSFVFKDWTKLKKSYKGVLDYDYGK